MNPLSTPLRNKADAVLSSSIIPKLMLICGVSVGLVILFGIYSQTLNPFFVVILLFIAIISLAYASIE
jgi:hypothetical protein